MKRREACRVDAAGQAREERRGRAWEEAGSNHEPVGRSHPTDRYSNRKLLGGFQKARAYDLT